MVSAGDAGNRLVILHYLQHNGLLALSKLIDFRTVGVICSG